MKKNTGKHFRSIFNTYLGKKAQKDDFSEFFALSTYFSKRAGATPDSQNYTNYTSIYSSMYVFWGESNKNLQKITKLCKNSIEWGKLETFVWKRAIFGSFSALFSTLTEIFRETRYTWPLKLWFPKTTL